MVLYYILDGYNIIKSDASGFLTQGSLEQQRERLISLINAHHPQGSARNRLSVVFDGPYESIFSGSFPRYLSGSVEVIFSEGDSADERIERLVADEGRAGEVVVVTDDRGLRRMLGGSGARFMAVAEFTRRLRKSAQASAHGAAPVDNDAEQDINSELKKRWLK